MTETYSLAITGLRSQQAFGTKTVILPDSAAQGVSAGNNALGAAGVAARTGAQALCKNRDGSFSWYTVDAERSTPANPVLKAV